jgi:hypothetical protein
MFDTGMQRNANEAPGFRLAQKKDIAVACLACYARMVASVLAYRQDVGHCELLIWHLRLTQVDAAEVMAR